MIEGYSKNLTMAALQPIPYNNITIEKGCTATQTGAATFALNKCGVYEVTCGVSAAASTTIQLYKDGVALPEAQRTGTSPTFTTLVQVNKNNNPYCACDSPVTIQCVSVTAATLTDANIVITKLC